MKSRLAWSDDYSFAYVRRGGVWSPSGHPADRARLAGWILTGLLAAAIVASGGLMGLYSARPRLDVESRGFAEAAAHAAADAWAAQVQPAGGVRSEGCLGGVTISPLPWSNLLTARYACSIAARRGEAVTAMTLTNVPDGWRVVSLHVTPVGTDLAR